MEWQVKARVGLTNLEVSRVGLGTAPLCGFGAPLPAEQSLEVVRVALGRGISLIDTAPLYSGGESERRLGAALAGTPRHSYVLSTKVGRLVNPDGAVRFDFSRDGVRRSLNESLRRLRLNRVDVVLVHDPDDHYDVAVTEAFPALADLRDQGVIRAIGAGMNQWPMLAEFAGHVDVYCFLKPA